MGKITILPDILCNQIAAGEVVERPAAAVKELVENSIDARSTIITVRLLDAGCKEILVVDNGDGMSSDDALLAIERHATSKIKGVEDLHGIRSLGFRGEALPSIAAVSRFQLVTRERDATSGTRLVIDGGILKEVRDTGCPAGTQIVVRDLFYNVPARRKFLRARDTELGHISDQFMRLAMAHPHIHFRLEHQGRTLYDLPQTNGHGERARRLLGSELGAALHPFTHDGPELSLHGLAGPPELQRVNGQHLFAYVNGRPIWDRILNRAILAAYDSLLPKGRFPVVIVFLELDAQLVDVNVHPTKREVRWRNIQLITGGVQAALKQALDELQQERWRRPLAAGRAGMLAPKWQEVREKDRVPLDQALLHRMTSAAPAGDPTPPERLPETRPPIDLHEGERQSLPPGAPLDEARFAALPLLGQLAHAYLLLEAPYGLVFIDQHAAHERILFERLRTVVQASAKPRQRLLQSQVLEFLPRQAAKLRGWLDGLRELGFEMEPFGGDSFVLHAVPAVLADYQPAALLRDLLESCPDQEPPSAAKLTEHLAKLGACRQALKAGQKLTREEILNLLEDLDTALASATCPHGRPLWWKLTHGEIARFFHRS
jgi:DNA mismatch repair protein MutL